MLIELYLLRLHPLTPADEATLAALLDDTEQARAARFRFPRDRVAFTAAHGLCRLALSLRRPAVSPDAWSFSGPPLGKPVAIARGGEDLSFSLSHTDGLVAVAVTERLAIGVDAEAIRPKTATDDLALAFCTDEESRALAAIHDPEAHAERFFSLWTLKESLLKATGLGLSEPPQSAAFRFDPLAVERLSGAARGAWRIWAGRFDSGHALALAAADPGHEPILRVYEAGDIAALSAGVPPPSLALALSSTSTVCTRGL